MNKRDQGNLDFLLTASTETLKDWYAKASEDDREYAMELLMRAAGKMRLFDGQTRTLH